FRLRHVEPTAMLGRVMPLDLVQQPTGNVRPERLVQTRSVVRVQVVLHQPDFLGAWVKHVHQLAHALRIVSPRAALAHLDVPPAAERLAHHQLVTDALAFVLVVLLGRAAGQRRQRRPDLAEQLLARLVEADDRVRRVVRQQVCPDHVFHPPDVFGIDLRRHAPSLNDPWVNVVFFSACRTVSVETVRTRPRATSSSHSRLNVQWPRPSAGSLQASWINFCSTSPLILILSGRGGWGLWSRATWSPSVTNRLRTRSTVRRLVPSAVMIPSSPWPWPCEVWTSPRLVDTQLSVYD